VLTRDEPAPARAGAPGGSGASGAPGVSVASEAAGVSGGGCPPAAG
jgi:hypothetical protein